MANLMGSLQGNRGRVHRLGSQLVNSKLQSWTHAIYTWLDKDGGYKIEICELNGKTLKAIEGNVKDFS